MDIASNLKTYLGARDSSDRYASFDYCFNYFQSRRESGTLSQIAARSDIELSCLQLGFYLASWGMLRGSSVLHQRSVKHYAPVVQVIAAAGPDIWDIDADCYSDRAIDSITEMADEIRAALHQGASDTLVTKIMLGVFGNIPAFDTYFRKGSGGSGFSRASLKKLESFYKNHSDIIENHRVPTIDFDTGQSTNRRYTRAKVIDMIFFIEGSVSGDTLA